MKALKAAVIGMAMLIVVGFGILVGYLVFHPGPGAAPSLPPPSVQAAPAAGPATTPFEAMLAPPPGSSLKEIIAARGRVILHFSGAAGDRLVFVDPGDGRVLGTLAIPPALPLPSPAAGAAAPPPATDPGAGVDGGPP